MKRFYLCGAASIWGLLLACSGEDSNRNGVPNDNLDAGGGTSGTGGSSNVAGGGQAGVGGTDPAPDAGMDGGDMSDSGLELPDAGADADAGPIVLPIPVCSPGVTWAGGSAIDELSSAATQELLAVTPDELTLVWLETDEDDAVVAFVADRADSAAEFSAPVEIPAVDEYDFRHGVAISPDGLSVVIVGDDGGGLAALHRPMRGDAFSDTVDTSSFLGFNITRRLFGDYLVGPELSSGDQSLYFTTYMNTLVGDASVVSSSSIRVTSSEDGVWSAVAPALSSPNLQGTAGNRLLTTGVSSDELTLFYWDEAGETEYVIWRGALSLPFENPIELGDYQGATPNQDCTRLYFSSGGVLSVAAPE